MKRHDPNEYPPGWDQARVRDVLDYYERQTNAEAAAEAEAALSRPGETLMTVPAEIVPAVRELISRYEEERMIERGLADAKAGRTISSEEMQRRIESWAE